jgi:hypothetical protein
MKPSPSIRALLALVLYAQATLAAPHLTVVFWSQGGFTVESVASHLLSWHASGIERSTPAASAEAPEASEVVYRGSHEHAPFAETVSESAPGGEAVSAAPTCDAIPPFVRLPALSAALGRASPRGEPPDATIFDASEASFARLVLNV